MAAKTIKKPAKKTAIKATKKDLKKAVVKPAAKKSKVTKAKELKPKKKIVTQKVVKKIMAKKNAKVEPEKKKKVKLPANGAHEVEVTSPKKVTKKIKGYNKEDLEYFRKIILEKRSEILEQLQNLREQMMDPTTGQYVNENSPYSLHMAEQGTDAMEREKIFLWAQRENKFLGYLDDALHRIENGTYGICIECIDEPQYLCATCPLIPKERLAAVPHSQLCLPVKQRQEKGK